jgi:hypothetical protein
MLVNLTFRNYRSLFLRILANGILIERALTLLMLFLLTLFPLYLPYTSFPRASTK